jgi:hypothetical protein
MFFVIKERDIFAIGCDFNQSGRFICFEQISTLNMYRCSKKCRSIFHLFPFFTEDLLQDSRRDAKNRAEAMRAYEKRYVEWSQLGSAKSMRLDSANRSGKFIKKALR